MQKFSDTKSWLPDIKNMMGNIPSWVGGVPQPKQGWNKFSDFLHSAMRETRKGPKLPGTNYFENVLANTTEVLVDIAKESQEATRTGDPWKIFGVPSGLPKSPGEMTAVDSPIASRTPHDAFLLPVRQDVVNEGILYFTGLSPEEYLKQTATVDRNGMSPQVQFLPGMDSKKMMKWFEDKNLTIPEFLTRPTRTQWGETQTLVLDPTKKAEVLAEADRLRRLGYKRIADSIPHMVKVDEDKKGKPIFKDSGLWSERWGKPDITHYPDFNSGEEDLTYRMLEAGIKNSVKKGPLPKNMPEVIGRLGIDMAAMIPTVGISLAGNPAIQETGGVFQENNTFDAVLNTVELAFPPASLFLGATDHHIRALSLAWTARNAGNAGNFPATLRAASNVKRFDPSVDLREFGENSVRQVQRLLDVGQTDEEANMLIRTLGQMSVYHGEDADYLASVLEFNKVSDAAANSAFEMTFSAPNKFAPEGYLFNISTVDQADIAPMRHNFDVWLDWADESENMENMSALRGYYGLREDKTFDAGTLLKELDLDPNVKGGRGRGWDGMNMGDYRGLRVSKEELYTLGIDRFLEDKLGLRVSINDLRQHMDSNRLKITEMVVGDLYSRDGFNSILSGPADIHGVALFKVDVPNMNLNSHIRRVMDGRDKIPATGFQHYVEPTYEGLVRDDLRNIAGRSQGLLDDAGIDKSPIPSSARHNIFISGRYSIRTDANGTRVFQIDEIQSDLLQKMFRNPKQLNSNISDLLLTEADSGNIYPIIWGISGDSSVSSWHVSRGSSKPIEEPVDVLRTMPGNSVNAGQQYPESMHLSGADIVLVPTSKHTATDEMVRRKFDDIIKQFDDDEIVEGIVFSDSNRPNVVDSVVINPVRRDFEYQKKLDAGEQMPGEPSMDELTNTFYRIELLDHVPGSKSGEMTRGKRKAPVIRISRVGQLDEYGNADVANDPNAGSPITKILTALTGDYAKRRIDAQRVMWSVDDLKNNKAEPFKIIRIRKGENAGSYQLSDTVRTWGVHETRDDAAHALRQYLEETTLMQSTDEVALPHNFIFEQNTFHVPVIRRMLFHAAQEGVAKLTLDTGQGVISRYGKKALEYQKSLYGDAKKASGDLVREALNSITGAMRASGWTRWKDHHSRLLLEETFIPVANDIDDLPTLLKKAQGGDGEISDEIMRQTGSLSWRLAHFKNKYVDVEIPFDTNLDDITKYNFDTRSYKFAAGEFEDEIISALDNVGIQDLHRQIREKIENIEGTTLQLEQQDLSRSWLGLPDEPQAPPISFDEGHLKVLRDTADILGELTKFSEVISADLYEIALWRDSGRLLSWLGFPDDVQVPRLLDKTQITYNPGGGHIVSGGFSVLDALEYGGIPLRNFKNSTDKKIILNTIIEEAVASVDPNLSNNLSRQVDDVVGGREKGVLNIADDLPTMQVHGIRLNHDLSDKAVRAKLGLNISPDKNVEAVKTVSEALNRVQFRLMQMSGETPRGGKVLGWTDFTNDGRYLVNFTKAANFRTAVHEIGHVFRRILSEDHLRIAGEYSMGKEAYHNLSNKNVWTRPGEEKFAEAFERYLLTDYAENREIATVFEQFKEWLKTVIRAIKGTPFEEGLDPKMKKMFDDILKPNRPSIRKIKNTVPQHLQKDALKFYGYRVDDFTIVDDGFETVDGVTRYKYKADSEDKLFQADYVKPTPAGTKPSIVDAPITPRTTTGARSTLGKRHSAFGNWILEFLAKSPDSSVDDMHAAIVKESQIPGTYWAYAVKQDKKFFYNKGRPGSKLTHPADRRPDNLPDKARIQRELTRVHGTQKRPFQKGASAKLSPIAESVQSAGTGVRTTWRLKDDSPDRLFKLEDADSDAILRSGEEPPKFGPGSPDYPAHLTPDDGGRITPEVEPLSSIQSMEDVLSANMIMDKYRQLAQLPVLKHIVKRLDPTTASNNPLFKAIAAHTMLKAEGEQKAQLAFARLNRLGTQGDVFGPSSDRGLLTEGPLKGMTVNTVRSNPDKYRSQLTGKQRQWVDTANALEDGKLQMLQSEGIEINLLTFEEGGRYAGRKILGKVTPDGEIIDIAQIKGEGGFGGKKGFEKNRVYDSPEEAIADGFIYMDDDEALLRNIQAAYVRVADKRATDYILNNVVSTRSTKVLQEAAERRAFTRARLEAVDELMKELQHAKSGGQINALTRKKLEKLLPEIEGMLDDVSQITLQQLVKAGTTAANQPMSWVPNKRTIAALFRKVKAIEMEIAALENAGTEVPSELVTRLKTMKKRLGFNKFAMREAYKNFEKTGTFEYTFSKSALSILMEDRVGSIDELITAIRGTPYIHTVNGNTYTRYRGGFIDDLKMDSLKANSDYTDARTASQTASGLEGTVSGRLPAFGGKIFSENQPTNLFNPDGTRMKGIHVQDMIVKGMLKNQSFSKFLNEVNTANSAFRFFMLAGDMSLFGIQLLFLTGHAVRHPAFLPNVMKAFVHAFMDSTVHAKYLDQNRTLIAKHPGMMLSSGGTEMTEFTRNMANAGFVRAKPIKMAADVVGAVPGTIQAGRAYVGVIKRAQSGFEAALDIAGIEMLKSLDHKAIDPKSTQQIDDFVNEFRGLANPARLGVTAQQRQVESLILLAPRYNRAIAAMLVDFFRGGIRGDLARKNIASSVAAITAMGVAFSLANGEDPSEIADHFKPVKRVDGKWVENPMFYTWNIAGQNIGFGSKVRSLVKLSGSIYAEMMSGETSALLSDHSMDNPGIRFIRGNLSPILGTSVDMLDGKTYMGEPVYGNGMDLKSWITNFSKTEILPKTMPIWVQAVLLEEGTLGDRVTRGTSEFFGGRGYPESSYQILKHYSDNILGIPYEDLEPFERRLLRDILSSELLPMMQKRLIAGDKMAMYWEELNNLDQERLVKEEALLNQFFNPRRYPQFLINGAQVLRREFAQIQNNHANLRDEINNRYKMYQDDQEFNEDDPGKFILQEWYALYNKAKYGESEVFDNDRLEGLRRGFFRKTLPNGESYSDYSDYIYRNTSTAVHPRGFEHLLSRSTVQNWKRAERLRREFLQNRGNWDKVLDNTQ